MIRIFSISFIQFFFISLFCGCIHAQQVLPTNSDIGSDGFPNHWWQVVPDSELPGWEIPPQAAHREQGEVVLSKRNELGSFSNLGSAEFDLDGVHYGSVEGLWQGMKYPEGPDDERLKQATVSWPYTRNQVMAMKGFEAKKAGDIANANMKQLGIKWITYQGQKLEYNGVDSERHYQLILRACRAKLQQNTELLKLLLQTKKLKFLPDHKQREDSLPSYKYHEIYMKLREEFQTESVK